MLPEKPTVMGDSHTRIACAGLSISGCGLHQKLRTKTVRRDATNDCTILRDVYATASIQEACDELPG
jgi:hypothetical protein